MTRSELLQAERAVQHLLITFRVASSKAVDRKTFASILESHVLRCRSLSRVSSSRL
jgi:hypothetical protein